MKKTVLASAAFLALGACMQGPSSPDEVRSTVNRGAMFTKATTVTVPRSFSAVTASLRQGAERCMNKTETSSGWTPGPYGPQYYSSTTAYRTTVKSSGGRTELAMYQEVLGGGFLPQPKGYSYVVDATPGSGGTTLKFYGGRFGYGKIDAAVEQWARGGAIVCPDLPGG